MFANRRIWRFRFTLRTLFVVVTIFAGLSFWVGVKYREGRRQKAVVGKLRNVSVDGVIYYDYQIDEPSLRLNSNATIQAPEFLRNLLGDDFFGSVWGVQLGYDAINNHIIDDLTTLNKLRYLRIDPADRLNDAGLASIGRLTQIRYLILLDSDITDASLSHLKSLTDLEYLCLHSNELTDAGLRHLEQFKKLKHLGIYGARISDAAVERLKKLLPQCEVKTN